VKALCLAALLASPAAAVRPITPPAPEFPPGAAWINSKPLSLAMMRGRKVVLVAFLNPTALNSMRLLPVLKAWYDRYALSQLMIVGVVTPDLEVQKDAVWVRTEMKHAGVDFPVVIDGDRRLWKSYANEGWPTLYVIDRKGRIVFDRLGEGDYAELEREMREALADLTSSLPDPVAPKEPSAKDCGHATPDAAMGLRAKRRPLVINEESSRGNELILESREGELSTSGKWDIESDGLRLAQTNADQEALVRVIYEAPQAFAVLAPAAPGRKTRFFLKLDGHWIPAANSGKDVRFDDEGRSFVVVGDLRLYDLARDAGDKPHELDVAPESRDGGVYGFTFADACTATELP
jgi:thiol-disulfide isomerase/thioredoxin